MRKEVKAVTIPEAKGLMPYACGSRARPEELLTYQRRTKQVFAKKAVIAFLESKSLVF